jgi:hypothetical protein
MNTGKGCLVVLEPFRLTARPRQDRPSLITDAASVRFRVRTGSVVLILSLSGFDRYSIQYVSDRLLLICYIQNLHF